MITAWHFTDPGTPLPPDNEWLIVPPPPILCASPDPFSALKYAPGDLLCKVELKGEILYGSDKMCATHRRIIKQVNVAPLLDQFARSQALKVAHLWKPTPLVLEFLRTGNPELVEQAYGTCKRIYDNTWASASASAWACTWDNALACDRANASHGASASALFKARAERWADTSPMEEFNLLIEDTFK